jgi:hypothetical protein
VFEVVEASADREAAQVAVASLLGIPEVWAGSVLDRQIYHFTATERARMRAEQTELRKRVGV